MTHNLNLSGCACISPTQKAFVTFWVGSKIITFIIIFVIRVCLFVSVNWRYGFVTLFVINLVDVFN